jgi:hypothetical protein
MSRLPFYDSIELSPEEEEEAILQGKIKKYFYEKNKRYWQEKEGGKNNRDVIFQQVRQQGIDKCTNARGKEESNKR